MVFLIPPSLLHKLATDNWLMNVTDLVQDFRVVFIFFQHSDEIIFFDVSMDWDGLTVRVEPPMQ